MAKKHLQVSMIGLPTHPGVYLRSFGIEYQHSLCFSVADMWIFFNCEHVPDELPELVKEYECENVQKLVGCGLTQEKADEIDSY